jgi:hypothetical protein
MLPNRKDRASSNNGWRVIALISPSTTEMAEKAMDSWQLDDWNRALFQEHFSHVTIM